MKPATQDALRFLRIIIAPRKCFNAVLLYTSYQLSRILGRAIVWGKPMSVSIEPTTACNLGCPQCPSGLKQFSRPTGRIQLEDYKKIIDQLSPELAYLILYFQGEPYLNKAFTDLVKYAADKKIYTATSTNAHFLNEENCRKTVESGLHRLIISIDGTSQETYAHYRLNGQLTQVLDGTKNLLQARKAAKSKTPYIIWQFIIFKHNEHETDAIRKLAADYGVDDLVFKSAQIYDYENGDAWIPENNELSRYERRADGIGLKGTLFNRCWRMWQGCVITWDGKVVPCCFDKDATHSMGHLDTQSFQSIWKSTAYKQFRSAILKGRDQIDICKNCSEGTRVFEKQVL